MAGEQPKIDPRLREKLLKGHEQLREKNEATEAAAADPLPGPLTEAFCKGAIRISDEIAVRKIVARDWTIFKGIEHPILKLIQDYQKSPDKPSEAIFTEEDEWALCWQFTRPVAEVRAAYEKGGKALIYKLAGEQVGDVVSASDIRVIIPAVLEQIKRSWQTSVKYTVDLQEKGEVTFFQEAGEGAKTDSASGSTTSPG